MLCVSVVLLVLKDGCVDHAVPHGVKHCSVLHNAKHLVGGCHVVGDGPPGVSEESVWCPNFVHHLVVQSKNLNGAFIPQPLVNPHLSKEHVHSVLLSEFVRQGKSLVKKKNSLIMCYIGGIPYH